MTRTREGQRVAICSAAAIIALHTKARTQAWIVVGLLLGYWAVMALVPVPHFRTGDYSPQGNLVGYIDRLLLSFPSKWCCDGFGDSEGIVTTIPAVATALLGTLTGHLLRAKMPPMERVRLLLLAGGACLVTGLVAVFHWQIDVKGSAGWAFFFRVIGMNAVVMYLFEAVLRFGFPKGVLGAGASFALLVAGLDLTMRWYLVYSLYRRRWFLKF